MCRMYFFISRIKNFDQKGILETFLYHQPVTVT